MWRQKESQVINRILVTRINRWTAILGRKCVIVGNGDSKGFNRDGRVSGLTSSLPAGVASKLARCLDSVGRPRRTARKAKSTAGIWLTKRGERRMSQKERQENRYYFQILLRWEEEERTG